jgi:hypothetical protein
LNPSESTRAHQDKKNLKNDEELNKFAYELVSKAKRSRKQENYLDDGAHESSASAMR